MSRSPDHIRCIEEQIIEISQAFDAKNTVRLAGEGYAELNPKSSSG
jgi:hypothetical protein